MDDLNAGLLPQASQGAIDVIKDSIALGDYDDARRRISLLQAASRRHAARTAEQIAEIREAWRLRNATDVLGGTIRTAQQMGIEYREAAIRTDTSVEAIIKAIGGGDMTEGSCASLAYAYAGNRGGFEVFDFRGGESRLLLARRINTAEIAERVGGMIVESKNEIKASMQMLNSMESGKEYILHTGSHAAVVRRAVTADGRNIFQYLELQTNNSNGWYPLTDWSLKNRFSARARRQVARKNLLIDIDKLQKDKNFKKLLGYINTDKTKQLSGLSGGAK
jgi:hypothetical protein